MNERSPHPGKANPQARGDRAYGQVPSRSADPGQSSYGGFRGEGGQPGRRQPRNWQRSDARLRDDICERLSNLRDADVGDVSVSVNAGRVLLEGTVPTRDMKHAIEDCAAEVLGVVDVDNRVKVPRA